MNGYVYISHNLKEDKYYIGCKFSDIFDDKYFGSGKYLKQALRKYGKQNFEVKILEWCYNFDNKKVLFDRETFWVEYYNAATDDKFYNISATGNAGNTLLGLSEEEKQAFVEKQRKIGKQKAAGGKGMFGRNISLKGENNPMYGRKQSDKQKELDRQKHLGKKASEETRQRMRLSHDPNNVPPSHLGRKHINKDGVRKSVKPQDLELYLQQGWKLGGVKRKHE